MKANLKIATHNSVTAEPPADLLSCLLTPFARCQRKTIVEQYRAGCRYFDLRLRWDTRRQRPALCHGRWTARRELADVLRQLNAMAVIGQETVYLAFCLERGRHDELQQCRAYVAAVLARFSNCHTVVTYWATKEGGWHMVETEADVPLRHEFFDLNPRVCPWRLLVPVPWLWAKLWLLLRGPHKFDNETFTQIDFL